jgi:hypothetical protein
MVVGIGRAGYGVWTIWRQHHAITTSQTVTARVVSHQTKDLKASGFVAKVLWSNTNIRSMENRIAAKP